MLTMQAFYNRLVSALVAGDAHFAPLSKLTRASTAQVAVLDLSWETW